MSWGKGQQVNNGRYEILDRIGTGGFGVTYKAIDLKHPTPNSIVAIKTLNEKRQRQANFEQLQENFLNEAMALAKCSHPHVIKVDRVFPDGQIWAMVMDYIEGESLEDYLIDRGKLSEPKAVEIIQKIGGAVSYVHAQKLLHRDIKPANILINPNGEPILIDFGLAREFVVGIARSMTSDRTPHYSPPEQAERRGDFQPPLDIYALAATLYTCVTGDLPPLAEIRIVRDSLIPPQQLNSGISDEVNRAILTGMALKPEDRSSTVEEWLSLMYQNPGIVENNRSAESIKRKREERDQKRAALKLDAQGVLAAFRRGMRTFSGMDISSLDLSKTHFPGITLSSANCSYINLKGANLSGGKFDKADLSHALLRDSIISKGYFSHANLQNADLRGADLSEAYLKFANLQGANLCGANLKGVKVTEEELNQAKTNFMTIFPNGRRGGFW
jgi:serine/threonine protein kinase